MQGQSTSVKNERHMQQAITETGCEAICAIHHQETNKRGYRDTKMTVNFNVTELDHS